MKRWLRRVWPYGAGIAIGIPMSAAIAGWGFASISGAAGLAMLLLADFLIVEIRL